MSLIKWNPKHNMDFFRDFDSIMNDFFYSPARLSRQSGGLNWSPRIDIFEKDSEIQVLAELPGIDKKDIDISVKENVLTISGEKKFEDKKEEEYYCCERGYGKFERSFRMADRIESENIKAEYKNGVLKLSIPKVDPPESASARIEIK